MPMAYEHLYSAAWMQEYKTKSTSEKCQNCYYHYCNENNRYGCKRFANTECPGVSNFITLRTFRFENFFGGPSTSLSWSEFTAQPIKSQFELCTRRRTLGGVYRKFVRSRWLSISTAIRRRNSGPESSKWKVALACHLNRW